MLTQYLITIGLEIHAHLLTTSKMFCGCPNNFGDSPNTNTCPICLGMPGALPVPNFEAIKKSILAGLALNCEIAAFTKWDRKHYFYPDLPKGFQISQYDLPLCKNGWLEINDKHGTVKKIGITRAHLEEDAGKLIHEANEFSLVDLNRAGTPLLEIVSEPEISSPTEAVLYAKQVNNILSWIGVCSGNLQDGALRFDINISIRPKAQKELSTKVEIKNLNSFRSLEKALEYEIQRQINTYENNEKIVQETRLWDAEKEISCPMRAKESVDDYRYFPEPDIPPFTPTVEFVNDLRKQLPLLPTEIRNNFKKNYELSELDSSILTSDKMIFNLFEKTLTLSKNNPILSSLPVSKQAKHIANWLSGMFLNLLKTKGNVEKIETASFFDMATKKNNITPSVIIELIELVEQKVISSTIAKKVFEIAFETGVSPKKTVKNLNLNQISNQFELEMLVKKVITENSSVVKSIHKGKLSAIGYLVGLIMKHTKGKANPTIINDLIKKELGV